MSGWIKFEKSIESDPRTLRMTRVLSVTHERFNSPFAVTLVVGALARLWCYADTHARDDDTLDLEPAELDDWLGVAGFCAAMPSDWLVVTDDNRLKLPGFHAHNGVEAKKRALTAKRVERHRDEKKRESVTPCNASALPDQTRPDHTKTVESAQPKRLRGSRLPDDWKPDAEQEGYARAKGLDPRTTAEKFANYWHAKAGREATKLDWSATWRNWCITEAERKPKFGAAPPKREREPTPDEIARARAEAAAANQATVARVLPDLRVKP